VSRNIDVRNPEVEKVNKSPSKKKRGGKRSPDDQTPHFFFYVFRNAAYAWRAHTLSEEKIKKECLEKSEDWRHFDSSSRARFGHWRAGICSPCPLSMDATKGEFDAGRIANTLNRLH
jgi:hypothetical protein